MISLIFFLVLFVTSVVAFDRTPPRSGLHYGLGWVSGLSVAGVFLSLALVEAARNQHYPRQAVWPWVPLMSFFLSFVPFLWLALIRRRVRDWLVFAAYLAAVATFFAVLTIPDFRASDPRDLVATEIFAGLMIIAPVHTVLAFSPTAAVSSWRDARTARGTAKHREPLMDAVAPKDLQ